MSKFNLLIYCHGDALTSKLFATLPCLFGTKAKMELSELDVHNLSLLFRKVY